MADLKKAGLNPILSAHGGASSPSGASANQVAPRGEVDLLGPGISTAKGIMEYKMAKETQEKSLELMNQQIDVAKADSRQKNSTAKQIETLQPALEAESRARKATAEIDAKMAPVDAVTKRLYEGLGAATDAVNLRNMLMGRPRSGMPPVGPSNIGVQLPDGYSKERQNLDRKEFFQNLRNSGKGKK